MRSSTRRWRCFLRKLAGNTGFFGASMVMPSSSELVSRLTLMIFGLLFDELEEAGLAGAAFAGAAFAAGAFAAEAGAGFGAGFSAGGAGFFVAAGLVAAALAGAGLAAGFGAGAATFFTGAAAFLATGLTDGFGAAGLAAGFFGAGLAAGFLAAGFFAAAGLEEDFFTGGDFFGAGAFFTGLAGAWAAGFLAGAAFTADLAAGFLAGLAGALGAGFFFADMAREVGVFSRKRPPVARPEEKSGEFALLCWRWQPEFRSIFPAQETAGDGSSVSVSPTKLGGSAASGVASPASLSATSG